MLDFILKYWIEELFVLLLAIGSFVGKKLWNRYKKGKESEEKEKMEAHENRILNTVKEFGYSIANRVDERIDALEKRMDAAHSRNDIQDENMNILKSGVLSLQKEQFLRFGKKLLEPDHIITYEEYMTYTQQHIIYNKLGGNHEGDAQFKLVETKYHDGLHNK